jgi:membrane protein
MNKKYLEISKDILSCFKNALRDTIKHDGIEHAGYLSFLVILSIFPFLVLLISIAGMLGNTELGVTFIDLFLQNTPREFTEALEPRINEILSGPPQGFLTIAIIGAMWTASSSVEGLRTIFNRAYRVSTPPSYFIGRMLSIVKCLIITIIILSSMFFIITLPLLLNLIYDFLNINHKPDLFSIRFIPSSIMLLIAVSFLYYFIPNLKQRLRNVLPGAIVVIILWTVAASLFTFYLHHFQQFNIIYGSLSSFIVAMLFFYFLAMILIFGAEFNYYIEKYIGFKFVEKKPQK